MLLLLKASVRNLALKLYAWIVGPSIKLSAFRVLFEKRKIITILELIDHTAYSRNNMGQNVRAIVVCGFLIAQPIQPISTHIVLDWLCYLAGNSLTAPTIFFKFSGYIFLIVLLRTHKPQLPSHFWPILYMYLI